jgi:hypothetical protein
MRKNQINYQLLNHRLILRNKNYLCSQRFTVTILGTFPAESVSLKYLSYKHALCSVKFSLHCYLYRLHGDRI